MSLKGSWICQEKYHFQHSGLIKRELLLSIYSLISQFEKDFSQGDWLVSSVYNAGDISIESKKHSTKGWDGTRNIFDLR